VEEKMACVATLVVETNEDNKLVNWHLTCEGKCPGGKDCEPVRHGGETLKQGKMKGWDRYTHECACNKQGDEHKDKSECKLIVFEYNKTGKDAQFKLKCLGHCRNNVAKPCRPVLIKEYKVISEDEDADNEYDLNDLNLNTVRHFKCYCLGDFA
jgi:hypothetical protein